MAFGNRIDRGPQPIGRQGTGAVDACQDGRQIADAGLLGQFGPGGGGGQMSLALRLDAAQGL